MPNAGITAFLSICFISCLAAQRSPRLLAAAPADVQGVIAQEPFDQQPGTITPCSCQTWPARKLDGLPECSGRKSGFLWGCWRASHSPPPWRPRFPMVFSLPVPQVPPSRVTRGCCRLCTALGTSQPWQLLCSTAWLCSPATHTRGWSWNPQELAEHSLHPTCHMFRWLRFFPWEMQKC